MNISTVVPFYFQSHEIRTVNVDAQPWFVAKDVCDVLGLDNNRMALAKIPGHHLKSIELTSGGQLRKMKAVDEPGLYRLILRSNKPQAEPFMEWVTAEVLPTIRKTGTYDIKSNLRTVDVFHNHHRVTNSPGGLDIRYTLDLTKVILSPNRRSLALLERLTGITVTDLDASVQGEMENVDAISRYLLQECRVADPDSPADEHGQRVPVKELYEHFSNWYRDWVDDKMRFLPSKRAFTTEICRRGARGMKRGGVRYVYGLQLAGAGEVRP